VPARILLRTGELERFIEIPGDAKNRWKTVEECVVNSGAEVVECLDEKGSLLRSHKLDESEQGGDDRDVLREEMNAAAKEKDGHIARIQHEQALMLDRYGDRLNEAFDRGAAAASVSQENLVNMVESLMAHWTMAITNLHNVSINLANALQGQETTEAGSMTPQLLAQVIGMAAAKAMGPATPPSPPNGAEKGKKS
jgi:hypothetical protein